MWIILEDSGVVIQDLLSEMISDMELVLLYIDFIYNKLLLFYPLVLF